MDISGQFDLSVEYDVIFNDKSRFEKLMDLELRIVNSEASILQFDINDCIEIEKVTEPMGMEKIRETSKIELYNGFFSSGWHVHSRNHL